MAGPRRLSVSRLTALALLLTVGYFCHLVSLGLTVGGLVVLAVGSPVTNGGVKPWARRRFARLARTCATFIPAVLLGIYYLTIATQRGSMRPQWAHLSNLWSPSAWIVQFEWVDPISLAIRDGLPLTERYGLQYGFFAPVVWLAGAVVLWWYGTMSGGLRSWADSDRLGWLLLSAALIIGGAVAPDSLGEAHGDYLPQRIVLMGLVALMPIFDIEQSRWSGRGCTAALVVAVVLQSVIVWDYALYSDRTAGQMIRAGATIGRNQRIATLLVSTRSRFRSNPLLHADNWLGVDTGNIVWNNYETRHYYFPVHFRPAINRLLRPTSNGSRYTRARVRRNYERATGRRFSPSTRIRSTW